jgi:uncharacterized protein with von Willebrand factor type A (vWA) domain
MNLLSGYEEVPGLFPSVVAGAITASALTFAGIYSFVAWRPRRRAQANIRQHSALRSLMIHHIDDVEDIVNYCIEQTVSGKFCYFRNLTTHRQSSKTVF